MSLRFKSFCGLLCLAATLPTAGASDRGSAKLLPSDCRPGDADSTCATAVAGASVAEPPSGHLDPTLYDGPLAGVPATGYWYWGFDFAADAAGVMSPVRPDEFINRSRVPVTISLRFNFPRDRPCKKDCLPAVEFLQGPGWSKLDPPWLFEGDTVSVSATIRPGQGYAWIIALWQASNPRLRVSVPKDTSATLADLGLTDFPSISSEVAAVPAVCACWDGSTAACSHGSRTSNGLLGPWYRNPGTYLRQGAFSECTFDIP
jgi:hypothetical protein